MKRKRESSWDAAADVIINDFAKAKDTMTTPPKRIPATEISRSYYTYKLYKIDKIQNKNRLVQKIGSSR